MRILVTGGAGYVGTVLVRRLLDRDHQVTVLDRLVFGCSYTAAVDGLAVWHADVRDDTALVALVPGHDVVIHLAFASNDPDYELDPRLAAAINLDPTRALLRIAARVGISRFVFVSSCSVYGRVPSGVVDESTPPTPLTNYARHKLMCETMVREEAARSGLDCIVLRPATACGPSPRQRLDLLLNRLLARAVVRREIRAADADACRPAVTLDDFAGAVAHVLTLPRPTAGVPVYNVVTETRAIGAWARFVCDIVGDDVALHVDAATPTDARSYAASADRLRQTGLDTGGTVRESLGALAQALVSGHLPDPLGNPAYVNLTVQKTHDFRRRVPLRRIV